MGSTHPGKGKIADDLKAQRFQMLEDIARELSGEVVFPTCVDVAIRARDVLRTPGISIRELAALVGMDPLLSLKVLRLANGESFNPTGRPVVHLESAIACLGVEFARVTVLALVTDQLMRAKALAGFRDTARQLWEHSLMTAVAARNIARAMTRLDPEEAMLAGLVHDLGAFYMLYRAAQYPELSARPDTVKHLVIQWHESIGESLMSALGVPEHIIHAIREHDHPRSVVNIPKTLADVVFVSNLVADGGFEWLRKDLGQAAARPESRDDRYDHLLEDIQSQYKALLAPYP